MRDPPRETRRTWLEMINRETQRLTTIVDDMLNVSRIQSATLTLDVERVDLAEVVQEVVEPLSSTSEKHRLATDIPASVPRVSADRGKLKQVLVNLVDNAIKYSPGGGTVTVAESELGRGSTFCITVSAEDITPRAHHPPG